MDALNFAYWLNGFAELHGNTPPTKEQWKAIREHLELVFVKVTSPIQTAPVMRTDNGLIQSADWWRRNTIDVQRVAPLRTECLASPTSQSYC